LFVANRTLLGRLLDAACRAPSTRLDLFIAVCIYGYVGIRPHVLPGVHIALISRRSTGRVGTRYHSRGIDDRGHVSNFVETEQIVFGDDERRCSLVQCRGSIPLYWRQQVDMRYAPVIDLYNYDLNVPTSVK
jgi:phosphatidylinositol 4-phosphatase